MADLRRPEAYPPPRPKRIDLAATHISWVFLTEDAAWKVKRPVDFGFVDFTTIERRRHFCEEELRLNRRLAPDVYLDVVPVRRGPAGHAFTGDAEIVDWAVKMRRLPDARSAAALLAAGALGASDLARLAARLAPFYADAPVAPDEAPPEVFAANVEENLSQLAPFAGDPLDPDRLARVAAAQRRELGRLHPQLAARAAAGRVRDGHGDLRLEHVYVPADPDAPPFAIDAVEFNPRFRRADVALDAAFLAMELEGAGRGDLGAYFVHRFARETNDYELFPLLDLYVGYRALVRAKVACLLAADPATAADRARRKREEAARLLALAEAHTHAHARGARPVVIAVGGLTGAGKSTLADALAEALGLPALSSDLARKHLGGIAPREQAPPSLYTDAFTARAYDELVRRAGLVLASGRGVILDATFRSGEARAAARALAAAHDAAFLFVEAACRDEVLRARLRARAAGPAESDADERVLDQIRRTYAPPDELPARERLVADTERPAGEIVPEIRRRLGEGA